MKIENEPLHYDEQVAKKTREVQDPSTAAGDSRVYLP
jgi:hypothetical protein